MTRKGIRIPDDSPPGEQSFKLTSILDEIQDGDSFYWSIVLLDVMGNLGPDKPVPIFQKFVKTSTDGYVLDWEELKLFVKKFTQITDLIILGSKNRDNLHHYTTDKNMFETCEVVIVLHDSSFWMLFSEIPDLMNRWSLKFDNITPIDSNY